MNNQFIEQNHYIKDLIIVLYKTCKNTKNFYSNNIELGYENIIFILIKFQSNILNFQCLSDLCNNFNMKDLSKSLKAFTKNCNHT